MTHIGRSTGYPVDDSLFVVHENEALGIDGDAHWSIHQSCFQLLGVFTFYLVVTRSHHSLNLLLRFITSLFNLLILSTSCFFPLTFLALLHPALTLLPLFLPPQQLIIKGSIFYHTLASFHFVWVHIVVDDSILDGVLEGVVDVAAVAAVVSTIGTAFF